jgi:hypothetical protein
MKGSAKRATKGGIRHIGGCFGILNASYLVFALIFLPV